MNDKMKLEKLIEAMKDISACADTFKHDDSKEEMAGALKAIMKDAGDVLREIGVWE